MKSFDYTITSNVGLHARPAGLLVNEASRFSSDIEIHFKDKKASAKKLFALMKLNVKQNDIITVCVEGIDEQAAIDVISEFFKKNF